MKEVHKIEVLTLLEGEYIGNELERFFCHWYEYCASVNEVPNIYELYSGDSEGFSMSAYSVLVADLLKERHPHKELDIFTDWDSIEDIVDYYLLDYHISTLSLVLKHRLQTLTLRHGLFVIDDERTNGELQKINEPFESVW